MAPEKSLKDAGNQKQKVMIAIVVIVILVVVWQVIGMKGSNSAPSISATPGGGAPANNMAMNAHQPGASGSSGAPNAMGGGAPMSTGGAPGGMMAAAPEPAALRTVPVQSNNELMKLQQQTQVDYISSINKLQMLKIQREIDETKTAIATAELNRMTAEKSIADLITSKESLGMGPDVPPPVVTTTTTTSPTPPPAPMPMPVMNTQPALINYTVLSVSYQGNKWTAILGNGAKTSTVNVGDSLDDGSVVTSISRNAVVLKREGKVRTVTIETSTM